MATFEEIGWTPIRLRRWLRVKLRKRWKTGLPDMLILNFKKEAAIAAILE